MILIAGLFLFQFPRYHPGSDVFENGFSSDTAIPILMINADYFSPFSLYYWGQDRFGSWPFLIFRAIGRVFSIHWSAVAVATGMYLFVHLCMLAYFWSARNGAWELLAGYAILHFWPGVATFIFDLSQPYGWQLGSLFLCFRAADGLYTGRSKKWISLILFAIFAFLSIWLSPSSVIFIGVYVSRALLAFPRFPSRWIPALATLGIVYQAHTWLRQAVVDYNLQHFLYSFETPLQWDFSKLELGIRSILERNLFFWELALWAGIGILALIYIRRIVGGKSLNKEWAAIAWILASFAFLLALAPLNWFELNQFAARYIVLPRYFLPLGAALLFFHWLRGFTRLPRFFYNLVAGAALIPLFICFPVGHHTSAYAIRIKEADFLEQRFPGIPIMGNYWNTYVYSALQEHPNLPQPGLDEYTRTPFLRPEILESTELIVNHTGFDYFLKNGEPVESLRFGGQRYILEGPRIKFENLDLSLYRKK